MKTEINIIAHIHTDFSSKFGIPRQSGLVDELEATIIFEPEYRNPDALRGIEEYSHLWLLWQFSECTDKEWTPTVRPPRLGGNKRMGVFATRSPFRPNPIGLSCVKLLGVEKAEKYGCILRVSGADLLDGTPI
ncbi:MAG: tRNA (N6-threonylcarbamoyladenosine(37)-N6)-methyltransferase TrmO, partial [Clostridia bacterium]|nr:tRNA (N6-threonylcarbamoyladenosine(37)-N6)-methyltransferase TrmO [Clostridia bacterium]